MSEEMQEKLDANLADWRKTVGLKDNCDVWSKDGGWYEAKVRHA